VPGLSPGLPPVSDVPGDAEVAGDRTLSAVEDAYLDALNDRRREAGLDELDREERLDDVAEYATRRIVKSRHGDGSLPDQGRMNEALSGTCSPGSVTPALVTLEAEAGIEAASSDTELGEALAERRAEGVELSPAERSITGLDIHVAPDGTTYLSQFTC
jgi:hypothetical protein